MNGTATEKRTKVRRKKCQIFLPVEKPVYSSAAGGSATAADRTEFKVWRRRGGRCGDSFVSITGRTRLKGHLGASVTYQDRILQPVACPISPRSCGPRPHPSRRRCRSSQSQGFRRPPERTERPDNSPDLRPAEHSWDQLGTCDQTGDRQAVVEFGSSTQYRRSLFCSINKILPITDVSVTAEV